MSYNHPSAVRFTCIKCGICCGDTQEKVRHILLMTTEAEKIANSTEKTVSEFAAKVEGRLPYSYEMRKTPGNGKCIFLKQNQCTIYALRPLICRFYPFELKIGQNQKPEFLHTNECPGIGKGKTLREIDFRKLFKKAQTGARMERRQNEGQTS